MSRTITTHPIDGFHGIGAKKILCNIPHYCIPGLNLNSTTNISDSNEAVQNYLEPDYFNLPEPYVNFSEVESRINAVLDIVKLKKQWNFSNQTLLNSCREKLNLETLNNIQGTLHENQDICSIIPLALSNFTSSLMENPDEYFDSEYNWYFKNTIEKLKINGKWYLACVRGVNLDILEIISINNDEFRTVETKEVKHFKGPIFDIKSSNLNDLMIRQKTKLFILSSTSGAETFLNDNPAHDNFNMPLADADIITNNFCTADVKHIIKQWKDRNCIQDKYFDVEYDQTDSFIHLSYLQNQADLIAIINRQKFYVIDSRMDISKPCSNYDPNSIIEGCEELTALNSSNLNTHTFYVTSYHSILTLDNRMGFVHKSHHMLLYPPSLITTHCYENVLEPNEMLLLGNQAGENLINLSYTSSQDEFLICKHMPSLIPKPFDVLHNVQLHGYCLNPILLDRFSRCLIGTTAFGVNINDLRLFSVNSAGDLFVQKVNSSSTPIDAATFKKKVTVTSQTISNHNCSRMSDLCQLWQLESKDKDNMIDNKKNVWSMSKEKITSYSDHLAPLLLFPWDVDEFEWEYEDENTDDDSDDSNCDYETKVNLWFDKNDSLLGSAKPIDPSIDNPVDFSSQATTTKAPGSEKDDSSSGFSISVKSDES